MHDYFHPDTDRGKKCHYDCPCNRPHVQNLEWIGISENASIAREGAEVAKSAREEAERRIGHSVISPDKAIDHLQSPEELPFNKVDEQ